jgi:phosphatidylinositol 4-kinase
VYGSTKSYAQHGNVSTLSLATSDVEETALVHDAVIRAIVAVACKCDDKKITALAISMLVQKIGRANSAVDSKIIVGSAVVGLQSSPNDFHPLLRLYARVATECLQQENFVILKAVRKLPRLSPNSFTDEI